LFVPFVHGSLSFLFALLAGILPRRPQDSPEALWTSPIERRETGRVFVSGVQIFAILW
jgi:hypothetical protein